MWLVCFTRPISRLFGVNKVDNPEMRNEIFDFFALGPRSIQFLSVHGLVLEMFLTCHQLKIFQMKKWQKS